MDDNTLATPTSPQPGAGGSTYVEQPGGFTTDPATGHTVKAGDGAAAGQGNHNPSASLYDPPACKSADYPQEQRVTAELCVLVTDQNFPPRQLVLSLEDAALLAQEIGNALSALDTITLPAPTPVMVGTPEPPVIPPAPEDQTAYGHEGPFYSFRLEYQFQPGTLPSLLRKGDLSAALQQHGLQMAADIEMHEDHLMLPMKRLDGLRVTTRDISAAVVCLQQVIPVEHKDQPPV